MSDEIFLDGARFISALDAARSADLSRDYITRLCKRGEVQGRLFGKSWYVEDGSLKEFLVRREFDKTKHREELSRTREVEYARQNIFPLEQKPSYSVRKVLGQEVAPSRGHGSFDVRGALTQSLQMHVARAASKTPQVAFHTPLYTVTPFVDFLHKAVALITAFMLTFGTYTFVDPSYAREIGGAIARAGTSLVEIDVGRIVRDTEVALARAVEKPEIVLAAASSATGGALNAFEETAARFNTFVDSIAYRIAFPVPFVLEQVTPAAPVVVFTITERAPSSTKSATSSASFARPSVTRVIERIIEPQTFTSTGISEALLNGRLSELESRMNARFSSLSSANSTFVTSNSNAMWVASRNIENIDDSNVTNSEWTGGTITNAAIEALSLSVTGTATSTFAGGINLTSGCFAVSGTCISGGGGGTPGGSGTQVQFNDYGSLGGDADFSFSTSTNRLSVTSATTSRVDALQYVAVGSSATTTIYGSATSTFGAGVQATYLNVTGTSATSTFANGIIINGGCVEVSGACLTTASFSYPFPSNATTTLLTFSGGLMSLASTTVGAGAQATGLTISGGATTTGNAYVAGNIGIGNQAPSEKLHISSSGWTGARIDSGNVSNGAFIDFYSGSGSKKGGFVFNDASNSNGTGLFFKSYDTAVPIGFGYETGGTLTEYLRINNSNGNVGIGTTSPYAKLSVVGQVVGQYFTATSTTSSVFPYASSTALTVSGTNGLQLATGLDGPLQANAGLVSATTSVGTVYGGTGITSYTTGDILYASAANTLSKLAVGSTGQVLKVSGGIPSWGADATGSGGAGAFATTSDSLAIYPTDTSDVLIIGASATSTTGNIFEVLGASLFRGAVTAYNTITASSFTATSTTASQFPYASSTAITVSGTASTSALIASNSFTFSNVSGFLKATAGAVATSLINLASDVTGILPVANGGTGWGTITASTLLTGNGTGALATTTVGNGLTLSGAVLSTSFGTTTANTWTALQQFTAGASTTRLSVFGTSYFGGTATSTFSSAGVLNLAGLANSILGVDASGNVVASSSIGTTLLTGSLGTVNGTTFGRGDSITITAASSTLLANNNTFSGTNAFANTTLTNGTSTSFAVTNITSAIPLANADGSFGEYAGTSCTNQFVRSINGAGVATCADVTLATDTTGNFIATIAGTANQITVSGSGSENAAVTLSLPSLLSLTQASSTQQSILDGLYVGRTATTTILGSATSTFGAGIQTTYLNVTGTAATSTFARGIDLTGGCFAISGTCIGSGGSGDITTVGSMTSGDAFADSTADDDWLGLGASAGRIEFDDLTIDEVNIMNAYVGIGTSTPYSRLSVWGPSTGNILEAITSASSSALTVSGTGFGTTTVTGLTVSGSATSTSNVGWNLTGGCFAVNDTCIGSGASLTGTTGQMAYFSGTNSAVGTSTLFIDTASRVGVGTSSPYAKFTVWGAGTGTGQLFSLVNNASTTIFQALDNGNIGIGTTSPYRKLSLTDAVSTAQVSIAYDSTRYTELLTSSVGDLFINPQGDDVILNDDNLWVCVSSTCPTGTPLGNGTLIVGNRIGVGTTTASEKFSIQLTESEATGGTDFLRFATSTAQSLLVFDERGYLGIGTSTPSQQLSISNKLFVANGTPASAGTATSTFLGDVLITGKLDVSTIDPVYTIDGVKYATYGHSTVGVKEELAMLVDASSRNVEGKYEYVIDFKALPLGSDPWLFWQVSDFGLSWENLVVSLTPGFDGQVSYVKDAKEGTLRVVASAPGEVSLRLIADRFDAVSWPTLRPDQGEGFKGFELQSKN